MHGSKNMALMFLLGATLVGGALGFAADRYIVKDRLCVASLSERESRTRFYDDIGLDTEQRAAWDALLDERRKNTSATHLTIRPRLDSIQESYKQRTRALLRPEQRTLLEQRELEMKRTREAERERNKDRK
jgi:hypothetical protein